MHTRQQVALGRLKTAYALNRIPVPQRDERRLARLPSARLEALADHWERRYVESEKDAPLDGGDEDEESHPGEPNLLHPRCTIATMIRVLRQMSGLSLYRGSPQDSADLRYHG